MYPNVNLNLTISAQLHTNTFVFTNRDAVENKDGTECVNWLLLLDTLNWKTLQKLYIVFIYSFIYFYPINLIIFTKMTGTWATKDWKSCGVLKNEVINVQEHATPSHWFNHLCRPVRCLSPLSAVAAGYSGWHHCFSARGPWNWTLDIQSLFCPEGAVWVTPGAAVSSYQA